MGYSTKPGIVRVDIFKDTGKWYETLAIDMTEGWDKDKLIHHSLIEALQQQSRYRALEDPNTKSNIRVYAPNQEYSYFAVCLKPYHPHKHPIVIWLK